MSTEALMRYVAGLDAPACVIDPAGVVCVANDAWIEAVDQGGGVLSLTPVRSDYLAFCDEIAIHGFPAAHQLAQGIRDILEKRSGQWAMAYRHQAEGMQAYFAVRIESLDIDHCRHVLLSHRRVAMNA
ncbi:hypothetical protein [Mangrovitalea sediminis]|uniref:hypothetical protein n=1 Tax=Mangrovitalea sediminis TaxID=1982043 RepID=UPI000BE59239|nr:hypothetical protein [Mangrovitalea sediminis]